MRYMALACDYDGTLACHDNVSAATVNALRDVRASGRALVLVTGRRLDDLQRVFPATELFDRVVAENGAVLYRPATGERILLADPPPAELVDELRKRRLERLETGEVIISTWHPAESDVLEVIFALGLEHQLIFNNQAVMVLPPGVNKATGLRVALAELDLSPHNVAGVGDAENDHAFLDVCEFGAAVANAVPLLKDEADLVLAGSCGAGVEQLVGQLLQTDLGGLDCRSSHHQTLIGWHEGVPVEISAYGCHILVAGSSGRGKTTFAHALLSRLGAEAYQFCVIDPEGDYVGYLDAVCLGDGGPDPELVTKTLLHPSHSAVLSLVSIHPPQRAEYFEQLAGKLASFRSRLGRPHWLVIDEAHHVVPATRECVPSLIESPYGLVLLTVRPEHVHPRALATVNVVVAFGDDPAETIGSFCRTVNEPSPRLDDGDLELGEAMIWFRGGSRPPLRFQPILPVHLHRRHRAKYAVGNLDPGKSFYFRGPQTQPARAARNLEQFLELAEGVDEETWLFHLKRGDYSRWIAESLGDAECAAEIADVERQARESGRTSRQRIRAIIEERYTAPV